MKMKKSGSFLRGDVYFQPMEGVSTCDFFSTTDKREDVTFCSVMGTSWYFCLIDFNLKGIERLFLAATVKVITGTHFTNAYKSIVHTPFFSSAKLLRFERKKKKIIQSNIIIFKLPKVALLLGTNLFFFLS